MKKKKSQPELPEVSPVKLKPFLGMQPGLYLTILYALMLVVLLFAFLVYPGLRNNGSHISFESLPSGAAVSMDGVYIGSTPFSVFVKKGEHRFTYKKPFFETVDTVSEIRGRIFGSLILPRRLSLSVPLEISDLQGFLNLRFRQVSDWALVGTFFDRYIYPDRGSSAVGEVLTSLGSEEKSDSDPQGPQELYDFTYMLINNINSKEMLEDMFNAFIRLSGEEVTATGAVSAELYDTLPFSGNIDRELLSLYVSLYSIDEETLGPPNELLISLTKRIRALPFDSVYSSVPSPDPPIRMEGHSFYRINVPAEIPVGNDSLTMEGTPPEPHRLASFPHMEAITPYYIDSSEVTRGQFLRFTGENPKWSVDNITELIERKRADSKYLAFSGDEKTDGSLPVTHVSWFAARAYCEWLTGKLSPELKESYVVRLPTETEWEAAARLNGEAPSVFSDSGTDSPRSADYTRAGRFGLADLTGNVWEWCENWYFPSDVLDGTYGLDRGAFEGVEKSIRGGSWVNSSGEISPWVRASQPPEWCSPFTGFRIVLAPRD